MQVLDYYLCYLHFHLNLGLVPNYIGAKPKLISSNQKYHICAKAKVMAQIKGKIRYNKTKKVNFYMRDNNLKLARSNTFNMQLTRFKSLSPFLS